jgi:uncharacterized membrane protein YqjE
MSPRAVIDSLERVGPAAHVVLAALAHRGELAALEAGETRDHLAGSLLRAGAVFALALLAGIALTFSVAAAVWHRDDRGLLLGLLTLGYTAAAAALAWRLARRLRAWRPLPEIRRQLSEDARCIQKLLPRSDPADESP